MSSGGRRSAGTGRRDAAVIALLCAMFILLRWKKMGSLLWLDPARWLLEFSRVARGELPYRDFSFQYPPFAAFLYGWLLRWFGITFTNAQVITDVIGMLVVALCWLLIRQLLPPGLRLSTGICLIATCATSLMFFNLFSFVTYIPSLQTGTVGILIVLNVLLRSVRAGGIGAGGWTMLACGGLVACLSKPEFILASIAAVACAAILKRDFVFSLLAGSVVLIPSIVVYAALAAVVGFAELRAALAGYGLATASCPWWPTGLGIFGALAALGEASMLAALASIPRWKCFRSSYGNRYFQFLAASVAGTAIYLAYLVYRNGNAFAASLSFTQRMRGILPSVLFTSAVLQPVLWVSLVAFLALAWRLLRGYQLESRDRELLLVLAVALSMASRSLFGSTQSEFPEVAAVCYPFFLILGAYFLWRFLSSAATPRYSTAVVATVLLAYACIRLVGAWPEMLSDRQYGVLETPAGTIRLLNYKVDTKVYQYLMAHTRPGDYVLDIPYGGGLNFATGRPSPIYTTQLAGMGWPQVYQQKDIDLFQSHPATLVIAQNDPKLGTYWSFGLPGNRMCACPRLVWQPDQPNWDPNYVFPLVSYIQQHYRVVASIGDKLILAPNQP
jgi:hypothetical protein